MNEIVFPTRGAKMLETYLSNSYVGSPIVFTIGQGGHLLYGYLVLHIFEGLFHYQEISASPPFLLG